MDVNRTMRASAWLKSRATPAATNTPVTNQEARYIRDELLLISKEAEKDDPLLSKKLMEIKDRIFAETYPYPGIVTTWINPFAFGEAIGILDLLAEQCMSNRNDLWDLIHPTIRRVSEKLYMDGSYANAACDAFIEINARVKTLFQKLRPGSKVPDGDTAMTTVFSDNSPLVEFCDRSTVTGSNIQKGFMQMSAGAMSALRNPKAHENITISKEDAMRRLMFASMLMYKIDEAVQYSNIQE